MLCCIVVSLGKECINMGVFFFCLFQLRFTADNGNGDIIARYIPEMNNKLCDGMWHSVTGKITL